jgi:hypothetical protein
VEAAGLSVHIDPRISAELRSGDEEGSVELSILRADQHLVTVNLLASGERNCVPSLTITDLFQTPRITQRVTNSTHSLSRRMGFLTTLPQSFRPSPSSGLALYKRQSASSSLTSLAPRVMVKAQMNSTTSHPMKTKSAETLTTDTKPASPNLPTSTLDS